MGKGPPPGGEVVRNDGDSALKPGFNHDAAPLFARELFERARRNHGFKPKPERGGAPDLEIVGEQPVNFDAGRGRGGRGKVKRDQDDDRDGGRPPVGDPTVPVRKTKDGGPPVGSPAGEGLRKEGAPVDVKLPREEDGLPGRGGRKFGPKGCDVRARVEDPPIRPEDPTKPQPAKVFPPPLELVDPTRDQPVRLFCGDKGKVKVGGDVGGEGLGTGGTGGKEKDRSCRVVVDGGGDGFSGGNGKLKERFRVQCDDDDSRREFRRPPKVPVPPVPERPDALACPAIPLPEKKDVAAGVNPNLPNLDDKRFRVVVCAPGGSDEQRDKKVFVQPGFTVSPDEKKAQLFVVNGSLPEDKRMHFHVVNGPTLEEKKGQLLVHGGPTFEDRKPNFVGSLGPLEDKKLHLVVSGDDRRQLVLALGGFSPEDRKGVNIGTTLSLADDKKWLLGYGGHPPDDRRLISLLSTSQLDKKETVYSHPPVTTLAWVARNVVEAGATITPLDRRLEARCTGANSLINPGQTELTASLLSRFGDRNLNLAGNQLTLADSRRELLASLQNALIDRQQSLTGVACDKALTLSILRTLGNGPVTRDDANVAGLFTLQRTERQPMGTTAPIPSGRLSILDAILSDKPLNSAQSPFGQQVAPLPGLVNIRGESQPINSAQISTKWDNIVSTTKQPTEPVKVVVQDVRPIDFVRSVKLNQPQDTAPAEIKTPAQANAATTATTKANTSNPTGATGTNSTGTNDPNGAHGTTSGATQDPTAFAGTTSPASPFPNPSAIGVGTVTNNTNNQDPLTTGQIPGTGNLGGQSPNVTTDPGSGLPDPQPASAQNLDPGAVNATNVPPPQNSDPTPGGGANSQIVIPPASPTGLDGIVMEPYALPDISFAVPGEQQGQPVRNVQDTPVQSADSAQHAQDTEQVIPASYSVPLFSSDASIAYNTRRGVVAWEVNGAPITAQIGPFLINVGSSPEIATTQGGILSLIWADLANLLFGLGNQQSQASQGNPTLWFGTSGLPSAWLNSGNAQVNAYGGTTPPPTHSPFADVSGAYGNFDNATYSGNVNATVPVQNPPSDSTPVIEEPVSDPGVPPEIYTGNDDEPVQPGDPIDDEAWRVPYGGIIKGSASYDDYLESNEARKRSLDLADASDEKSAPDASKALSPEFLEGSERSAAFPDDSSNPSDDGIPVPPGVDSGSRTRSLGATSLSSSLEDIESGVREIASPSPGAPNAAESRGLSPTASVDERGARSAPRDDATSVQVDDLGGSVPATGMTARYDAAGNVPPFSTSGDIDAVSGALGNIANIADQAWRTEIAMIDPSTSNSINQSHGLGAGVDAAVSNAGNHESDSSAASRPLSDPWSDPVQANGIGMLSGIDALSDQSTTSIRVEDHDMLSGSGQLSEQALSERYDTELTSRLAEEMFKAEQKRLEEEGRLAEEGFPTEQQRLVEEQRLIEEKRLADEKRLLDEKLLAEEDERAKQKEAERKEREREEDEDDKRQAALFLLEQARRMEDERQQLYVVREGDTLESIAKDKLTDVFLAALIYELNMNKVPVEKVDGETVYTLEEGTVLVLPSRRQVREWMPLRLSHYGKYKKGLTKADITLELDPDARKRREHVEEYLGPLFAQPEGDGRPRVTVRLGDTLRSIAMNNPVLNDVIFWPLLAKVNGLSQEVNAKGQPVAQLRRGQLLILPTRQEIAEFRLQLQSETRVSAPRNAIRAAIIKHRASVVDSQTQKLPAAKSTDQAAFDPEWVKATIISNFIEKLGESCRIVRSSSPKDGKSSHIAQLEVLAGESWQPVVTYEISDTFSMRHEFRADGRLNSMPIDLPVAQAHELVANDLRANWQNYSSRFLEDQPAQ